MALTRIGKYEIVAKVGRGAMGEVYKAHDAVLGRFVALKTISKLLDGDEHQRARFLKEAQSAAQLNHPNIITIYDFGEEEGVAYIVMELLEGTDLKDLIDSRGITRVEDKLAVMEQICDGLAFAHARGMVHRDLKPGNIHVLPSGQVKIMDFGLARRSTDTSRTEEVIGTPNYMSPEQVKGERASARSDIFSLGGVFYELLSNRKPFGADTIPAVLFNVVHREAEGVAKWVPELPALADLINKCLAKDPAQRYADAGELREALRALRLALGGGLAAGPALAAALASDTVHIAAARPPPQTLSETPETDQTVKDALLEFQQYLADHLPPLMVAESMDVLLDCPPAGVAADIYAWALRQVRGQASAPLVEILLHALRKIHEMGELKLVERERLGGFLEQVVEAIAGFCSSKDQEVLRRGMEALRRAAAVEPEPVEAQAPSPTPVEPPAPAAPAAAQPPGGEEGARRLRLLLDRLRQEQENPPATPEADESRSQLVAEALAAVAFSSRTGRELDEQLEGLRRLGVAVGMEQVFGSLGRSLSDWILPAGTDGPEVAHEGREVEAMRRIIALAEEPVEVAKRFRDLVYAAIEQFNRSNLAGSVKMIELAESLVEENQVQTPYVETVRNKGHESLDQGRVRAYAESPDSHPRLRKILNFFFLGLGVPALIDELQVEQRRDRRRLLLTLLQVHGPSARETAFARLQAFLEGRDDPGPYLLRNLVHLLRVVPRSSDETLEGEVQVTARLGEPANPALLVREAITYLGQLKHPRARQALVKLLHDHETRLADPALDPERQEEGCAALDKVAAALARQGGPAAWTPLVDHALGKQPGSGDTMSRLSSLAGQDLSSHPPLVARLLEELRASLPRTVLGFMKAKRDHDALCLVEALSGTPAPEVREALQDIVTRFPSEPFTRPAARALEGLTAPPPATTPPVASHTGELEVFGLPGLLHRLGEPGASGRLVLRDRQGAALATLTLAGGRLLSCEVGPLKGPEAVYQLIERPFAGSFSFEEQAHEAGPSTPDSSLDVASLTVEGIRRYRDLLRATALVPDDASLEATGTSPTAVPDETDYSLIVSLWERACAGATPRQCEAALPVDSFRIRRALAYWFEEGALRWRGGDPPDDAPTA